MKNMDRVIVGGLLLLGLGFGSSAHACTTDGWLGGVSGMPANGDAGSPLAVSRYSEFCALEITDTSWVQSSLASDNRYIGRFYVLPELTGSGAVDLFIAYEDEVGGAPLFVISYTGSSFEFDADGAGGGSGTATAESGWNLIEFEYDADSGNFNYWVNETWNFVTEAYTTGPTGTFASGGGTVESVRLGAPSGLDNFTGGTITYDAFEAHRTTSVGALKVGDANGNNSVNIFDMIGVQNEILDPANSLAVGQPDCNENGSVNVFDMICVQNIILAGD
jgi:hypothetical protein